ncbi:dual specificity protein phosphatase MPK-4 [Culicoides brevitarsis]|uniref:dual specificity protein phosphatase MPK-4 n=1 Tax=Culicoides brevitarsis TaxID=469753 RepID=UPI00307B59A2
MFGPQATSSLINKTEAIENPISIDLIEPHLYLGNATVAMSLTTLNELKINHILTIDSCPLPDNIRYNPQITSKYIKVFDVHKEDMLQYFEECIEFIENVIKKRMNVLVHCYYGVSRSATIVIAYIMKKHKMKYDKAFELVKSKRKLVGPNPGFIQQLRLFHRMGFQIDKNDEKYKIYRLRIAAESIKLAKRLPSNYSSDLVKPDPSIAQEIPEPIVFRCKRCRRVLANKSNLLPHFIPMPDTKISSNLNSTAQSDQSTQNLLLTSIENNQSERSEETESSICSEAYFFEPIAWMTDIINHTQGSLNCPKCKAKLGKFNWVQSSKCPCGKHVQPAFYMMPSKIEKSNVVQNVQVTV